jgi:P27 family predicted phage terminase small subunit
MGRRPKPTRLKVIAGNPGKRPLNAHEPRPEPRAPKCPSHLTGKARAEWRRMSKHLFDLGLLTDIDRAALAGYCQAYGRWVEAEEALAKHGIVVRSPSGFPMASPFLAIANKALEQMHRFGIEFGLTPASRSRVSAVPPQRADNPFARNGRRQPNPYEGM